MPKSEKCNFLFKSLSGLQLLVWGLILYLVFFTSLNFQIFCLHKKPFSLHPMKQKMLNLNYTEILIM